MRIQAAVARQARAPFVLESVDIEAPRPGEILVRMAGAGICHTDIVVRDQLLPIALPAVFGHEGSGVVEKVGEGVTTLSAGDHVVMSFASCGDCPSCNEHEPAYCHEFFPRNFFAARPDGSTSLSRDGERIHSHFFGQSSFATHAVCAAAGAVKVAAELPLELLGPLGCGVLTGAGAMMNALSVRPGSSVAVVGTGTVGLSAIMAAAVRGAKTIVAADLSEERLALARELGATHAINPKNISLTHTLIGVTGYGVDCALDTTGAASVIREILLGLAPRGTCGILGASAAGSEIAVDEVHLMSGGRRLIGIV